MSDDATELGASGKPPRDVSLVLLLVLAGIAGGYWAGTSSRARAPSARARPADADGGTINERLEVAAGIDDAGAVRDLLARGVSPCRGTKGCHVTALHYAAGNADAKLVRQLIAAGADPNGRTIQGETPLMQLSRADAAGQATLRALLDGGADIDAVDAKGSTAVERAERRHDAALVELLKRSGARWVETPSSSSPASPGPSND
jgi:ankyrin repeat protein